MEALKLAASSLWDNSGGLGEVGSELPAASLEACSSTSWGRQALTGGKDSPALTPPMRAIFAANRTLVAETLKGLKSFTFLARDDVRERRVDRDCSRISHILYYKLVTEQPTWYYTFYLTAAGRIAGAEVSKEE